MGVGVRTKDLRKVFNSPPPMAATKLDRATIDHVAALSSLSLTDAEAAKMTLEIGTILARRAHAVENQRAVPLEIADDRVDLRQSESHRFQPNSRKPTAGAAESRRFGSHA